MHSAISPPGSTRTSLFIIFWLDFMENKIISFQKNVVSCTLIWFGNLLVQLDSSVASNCLPKDWKQTLFVCVCVCVWIVLKTFDIYYCLWCQELQGIFHGQYFTVEYMCTEPIILLGFICKTWFSFPNKLSVEEHFIEEIQISHHSTQWKPKETIRL